MVSRKPRSSAPARCPPSSSSEWAIERIEALNPTLNAVVTPTFEQAPRRGPGRVERTRRWPGCRSCSRTWSSEMAGVALHRGFAITCAASSPHQDSELVRRLRPSRAWWSSGKTNTPEFGMAPTCEPVAARRRPATPGTPAGRRAGRAAGRPPRSPRGWCRWRTATTWAARCATPPRRAGCSGSSRPGPGCRSDRSTATPSSGWACEHALTAAACATAPRSSTPSRARRSATRTSRPPPRRPFLAEVGADPGRLRIGYSTRTRRRRAPATPTAWPPLDDAVLAAAPTSVTRWSRPSCPGSTPEVGAAIGTVFYAATAWIVGYWIRRLGRPPGRRRARAAHPRLLGGWGVASPPPTTCWRSRTCQRFARGVAALAHGGVDVWLTPTMSTPPAPLGEITSTSEEPLRAPRGRRPRRWPTPAWSPTSPATRRCRCRSGGTPRACPIGVHFLGRFGDEATLFRLAGQVERARPWIGRRPPASMW